MTDLPGKDTIEAVEKRIGKLPTKIAIWILVAAAVVAAGSVIVDSLGKTLTWLRPYLPQVAVPEAAFRVATILVYLLLGFGAWLVARRFQKFARNAEQAIARDNVTLDAIARSENAIKELNVQLAEMQKRLIEAEKKVGTDLQAQLVKELMKRADERYIQMPKVIDGATEGNLRVEQGKKILREAAAEARRVVKDEKLDFSSAATAERGWLHMLLTRFAREILSAGTFAELRTMESIREEKMKQRNQSPDGKDHFIKTAEHLEGLADDLTLDDLDPECDPLPASFEQFRKAQN